jgi:hypothetical protein
MRGPAPELQGPAPALRGLVPMLARRLALARVLQLLLWGLQQRRALQLGPLALHCGAAAAAAAPCPLPA